MGQEQSAPAVPLVELRDVTRSFPGPPEVQALKSVNLVPDPLTPQQVEELKGSNVRVSIPVGATQGPVLSVPLAAVSAGPGGENRVEVVEGDPREGEDAPTRLVDVETGLAAQGVVEVRAAGGDLAEGDLVVVGR